MSDSKKPSGTFRTTTITCSNCLYTIYGWTKSHKYCPWCGTPLPEPAASIGEFELEDLKERIARLEEFINRDLH